MVQPSSRTSLVLGIAVPVLLGDVEKAGGWQTVSMVTEIYQLADDETTLAVVLGGAEIREIAR